MKITQFKKMLAIHGADTRRWRNPEDETPGIDEAARDKIIAGSPDAARLYRETLALDEALDSFLAPAPDPALIAAVMRRIDASAAAQPLPVKAMPAPDHDAAPVHILSAAKKQGRDDKRNFFTRPFFAQPVFWGGGAAVAAMLLLFVAGLTPLSPPVPAGIPAPNSEITTIAPPTQQHTAALQAEPADTQEIETALATLDAITAEEIESAALISLLRTAEARPSPDEAAIDHFLDEMFSAPRPQNAEPEETAPSDLWELFLESHGAETQEL